MDGIYKLKTAIVTGGTSGIGKASAIKVSREGTQVIILGRNAERGNELCEFIKNENGTAFFIQCDIGDEKSVQNAFEVISTRVDSIDYLFLNAGIMKQSGRLPDTSIDDWKNTFDININGNFFFLKHFDSLISKGASIVINASIAGMQSYIAGESYAYSASKAALIQLGRQMALNYAYRDIRVNCICPGIIDTPILGDRDREKYAQRVPLGRLGTVNEIAELVWFLLSDKSSYITGSVVPIDGGVSI